jgi:hypothetical protein
MIGNRHKEDDRRSQQQEQNLVAEAAGLDLDLYLELQQQLTALLGSIRA